jgi:hypothetical protein
MTNTITKVLDPKQARAWVEYFSKTYGDRDATKGSAAYEYIHGLRNFLNVNDDPRFLLALRQPDGALCFFNDGSILQLLSPDVTPEQAYDLSRRLAADDPEAVATFAAMCSGAEC